VAAAALLVGCGTADVDRRAALDDGPIRLGAIYPLTGPVSPHGEEEYQGVATAVDLINADGGVGGDMGGRAVELVVRDAPDIESGWRAGHDLAASERVPIVLGTYSSTIALAATQAVSENARVYWETGAVADLVVTQRTPNVYRASPSSAVLAGQAVTFLADSLAPAHGLEPADLRLALVYENGPYGGAVGQRAAAVAEDRGIPVVADIPYDPRVEDFVDVIAALEAVQPTVLIAATYLDDGVRLRRALIDADVDLLAIVGKCAAFFTPEFAAALDGQASGVFVSDKPMSVGTDGLSDAALELAERFTAAYEQRWGEAPTASSYTGFSSAWLLLREVLPRATGLTPAAIRAATLEVDLPLGALPNGAGALFAGPDHPFAGQNLRALGVVWQWQGDDAVLVWPPDVATGVADWGIARTGAASGG